LSKIKCAKKHFAEISYEVKLVQSDNFKNLSEHF